MVSWPPIQLRTARYPGFGALLLILTLLGAAAYARHLLLIEAPQGNVWSDFAGWLTSFYPWVLLSPVVFRLEQKLPIPHPHWLKHLAWLVLAGLPLTYLSCKIALAMSVVLRLALKESLSLPSHWWSVLPCEFLLQQALYWLSYGGACIIRNLREHEENEIRTAQIALEKSELENSLRQAELETMRMRLNPHFLFNCLQNISGLTRRDPDTASRMLARLGDLLRSAIGQGTEAETTFEAEIELTKAYATIEQMRFQGRLSVLFEIEPGLERSLVPSFLLQPLVENAVKHGLDGDQGIGCIVIRGIHQANQLVLTVRDNGSGFPKEKFADLEMGIGLGSTSGRLERMYPGQHRFSIRPLREGGTEVSIVLPLRWQQNILQETRRELIAVADRG